MTTARAIVTRPEPDAGRWARQLAQAGIPAEAFALIDIAPLSAAADAQALSHAWQALDGYAACLFVSGHAVAHFFKKKRPFAQDARAQAAMNNVADGSFSGIPPRLRFMAPGPGTVAALRAAGVPAAQIDAPAADARQFDSEALWQTIGARDWQGCRVLVVRGQSAGAEGASSGRDWIVRQWQGAGASVDFVGVYQRRAPLLTDAQVARARQASADGSVWLFSSSEAVAHLVGLGGLQGVDWRHARAVATHPRIAQAVRAAGWGVVVESRPALQDIRQTLGSIELQHP
ncbi:uroporphyrinogen-III synthase [Polaromonas glacialis]|uniref:uroporphyrinogen-III synthase n=1 Tax=Polaromonas glacialis TaxID=866564 RepID=UPI000496F602|nr:uroporphyrinogen-III synthase [Polaromonas glacialis]